MSSTQKSVGQVAYEAYFEVSDGRSLATGQTLPTWEETSDEIRTAWEEAGKAAVLQFSANATALLNSVLKKQLATIGLTEDSGATDVA